MALFDCISLNKNQSHSFSIYKKIHFPILNWSLFEFDFAIHDKYLNDFHLKTTSNERMANSNNNNYIYTDVVPICIFDWKEMKINKIDQFQANSASDLICIHFIVHILSFAYKFSSMVFVETVFLSVRSGSAWRWIESVIGSDWVNMGMYVYL